MKPLETFLASLAFGVVALLPAAALTDDELDVTMTVLERIADMDGPHVVIEGPHSVDLDGDAGDSVAADGDFGNGVIIMESDDDFTHDSDFDSDDQEWPANNEGDFDEGEQVDIDVPEEEPMDDEESVIGQT